MSYGTLVVGYKINLNDSTDTDIRDYVSDGIYQSTKNALWLAGGEYQDWKRKGKRWTPAFVCKTVSYLYAESGGDSVRKVLPKDLANMNLWLQEGLPEIQSVQAMLNEFHPELTLDQEPQLYMVLEDDCSTVSSELMFGSSGYLEWCDQNGWTVSLPDAPEKAQEISAILNTETYNLTEKDSFDLIDIKSEIINKDWFTIIHFYDEDVSYWELILGERVSGTFLYKDTHLIIQPSLFNREGGSWFHRVWQSG